MEDLLALRNALRRLAKPRTSSRILVAAGGLVLLGAVLPVRAAIAFPVTQAQACPVISGYVYYDVNDNGLREAGEPPIAGVPMQLRNAAGGVVGSTSTNGGGYYEFDRNTSGALPTLTQEQAATFLETITDWTSQKTIAPFDPALGTLTSIEVTVSGDITSSIEAESLDSDPSTLSAEVTGTITVNVPGMQVTAIPLLHAGEFDAAPYDGVSDFGGASGHDFGTNTASDSATSTITDASTLNLFSGPGEVTVRAAARALSRTTGSGNVLNEIHTTASAEVEVVYRYQPLTCLVDGTYTIVEVTQPAGYGDGQESAGNVTPIPGSKTTDLITVTLAGQDRPNNNFGELRASLQGCVYIDANRNGLHDSSESGIPNVTITLGGTATGSTATGPDGCYQFPNLPPGTYTLTETQPPGYEDCQDNIGTQGGQTANDRFYDIPLPANVNGRNNDFGECLSPTPTPTATRTPNPTSTPVPSSTVLSTPPAGSGTSTTTGGSTPPSGSTPGSSITGGNQPNPGAPSSGSGLFSRTPDVRVVILGFAIFAASGWIAFLAMGRARDQQDG